MRITFSEGVFSALLQEGNTHMYIEPACRFMGQAQPNEYIGYLPKDLFIRDECPTKARDVRDVKDEGIESEKDLPSLARIYTIAMIADTEFVNAFTNRERRITWSDQQVELVNVMNGMFASHFTHDPLIEFRTRHWTVSDRLPEIAGSTSSELLDGLKTTWSNAFGDANLRSVRDSNQIDLAATSTASSFIACSLGTIPSS